MAESGDRWARWLGERRFAGDEETRARAFANLLIPLRDAVLDGAEPIAGATMLDIGCGDGLIAFGSLDRGAAEVVFADISSDLLVQCQDLADAAGVRRRCRFVQAPAEDLAAVETGSVDAATVRSVLIYVADKRAAFREFARVLRPGGRLSIFEPINRFGQRGGRVRGSSASTWHRSEIAKAAAFGEAAPPTIRMLDGATISSCWREAGFFPVRLTLTAGSGRPTPGRGTSSCTAPSRTCRRSPRRWTTT
jgi:SAM-dependent methyltransferase